MIEHTNQWQAKSDPKNIVQLNVTVSSYCYKMKNQVALLKAFDELIKSIKHFSDVKFYI